MIAGKTAAIVRYAAWGGALLGGADDTTAEKYGEFGLALGLGFQVRDDLLGVWGSSGETGKADADDIRRKKKSLPIVILHEEADDQTAAELDGLYASSEIDVAGIDRVLAMLNHFEVRDLVEQRVRAYHDEAENALDTATQNLPNSAKASLLDLVASLAARTY
jgi:geranylgeranyl diphosphate synthase type I